MESPPYKPDDCVLSRFAAVNFDMKTSCAIGWALVHKSLIVKSEAGQSPN